MVDAFTFDNGAPKRFSSRQDMYDYMVENGHVILEGDDAPKFKAHVDKRAAQKEHKLSAKATEVKARLEE